MNFQLRISHIVIRVVLYYLNYKLFNKMKKIKYEVPKPVINNNKKPLELQYEKFEAENSFLPKSICQKKFSELIRNNRQTKVTESHDRRLKSDLQQKETTPEKEKVHDKHFLPYFIKDHLETKEKIDKVLENDKIKQGRKCLS